MVVVVSDTSPIRALAHLNHLERLRDLFGEVLVPPAVADELNHPSGHGPAIDVKLHEFLRIRSAVNRLEVNRLLQRLDPGESEALALASQVHAQIVLIDEAAGRSIALQRGFLVVGTCGILVRAKERGLIPELKPLLDDLIDELGFFISQDLLRRVLESVGENV